MKLKFIYATLALLLLFSCSVEDNLESSMQDNNEIVTYKVAQEEAQNIVQGFIDEMSFISSTRSANEMSHKEISNVYALRRDLIQTRSGADGNDFPVDLDTLMYVVNFSNDNGFVYFSY